MEEKIRLAVFGQKRLSREGGIEIVVKELCTRMAQNGCDITCYNRAGHHVSGAEYDKTIEYDGIRQKVVPTIEKKGLAAVSSSFFAALCSAFGRYDVVHIHAEGPAFFCWIPKLFGKRVICTIHGLDWDREKWRGSVASKFIRGGEKNAVKYADEIIVLSKDVQKYFLETYGRETHFIPNGVNRPEVREAKLITDHFGLEKDSYILFLGRLVPEKGIRYLVEAFKNVKTDKKLVIAGGSSDTDSFMEELKELAKGDDRILFTGFVQGAMLDELYSNAYIYTLPSDLEGMPLSLLEAMSYGNCCLVSDIPECAAFGCRTSVERSQSYLNQFWKKRILALFVPAILINMISFGFKVMSLNVYEVRGLYAFNQYIYAIIVAYLVFWIIWKTKAIPVDIKDWLEQQ